MTSGGDLLKANATVMVGTLASRLTGFAKLILIVQLLDDALTDAYLTANNLPNQVYELVLGGVLTASLIPMFTDYADRKDHDSTAAILGTAIVALLGLTIVTIVAAPLIVWIFTTRTPAAVDVTQFRNVTRLFAILLLPQIFFYGITFLAQALLNAVSSIRAAAWVPALNNVIVILAASTLASKVASSRTLDAASASTDVVMVLGVATTVGVVAMALVLVPAVIAAGVPIKLRFDRHHPAVRQIIRLSTWTIGYSVANQISLFVITVLAKPGSAGVTVYQMAYLIVQLPFGLLAMSVMTTFGPELARERQARRRDKFVERFTLGFTTIAALLLPAGAGLIAFGRSLPPLLGPRGSTSADLPALLGTTLAGFAIGLFALGGYLFTLRGFFAHNDTRTPFAINVVQNLVNIVLALALVGRFGVAGLAWAFSISYLVALGLALRSLDNKLGGALPLKSIGASMLRLSLAAIVAGEVAYLVVTSIGSSSRAGAVVGLVVGGSAAIASYIGSLAAMGAPK